MVFPFSNWYRRFEAVADPDLQIRGGGGGGGWFEKKYFQPFGPQFRLKIRGGGPSLDTPLPSSPGRRDLLITHARCNVLGVWRQKRDKIDCHISSYSKLSLSTVKRLKFVFLTLISCDSAVPVECGLVCHVWNVYQATGETQFSALCHHW